MDMAGGSCWLVCLESGSLIARLSIGETMLPLTVNKQTVEVGAVAPQTARPDMHDAASAAAELWRR
jgi:predicted ATP-grasp superfamily ATP-dependent carboligase